MKLSTTSTVGKRDGVIQEYKRGNEKSWLVFDVGGGWKVAGALHTGEREEWEERGGKGGWKEERATAYTASSARLGVCVGRLVPRRHASG